MVKSPGTHVQKYSNGRLAFKRVEGEPPSALPKHCQLLERERTIMWEQVS